VDASDSITVKICEVRHFIECLLQSREKDSVDPLEFDTDDREVHSRDASVLVLEESVVAFRFYSSASIAFDAVGLSFKLQDHEVEDSTSHQHFSEWHVPGGHVVTLENLPKHVAAKAKDQYGGYSFVRTRIGTFLPFSPKETFMIT